MTIRTFLISAVSSIALTTTAFSADLPNIKGPAPFLPPPQSFSWTGVYVGAHGGYGWGNSDVTTTLNFPGLASFGPTPNWFQTSGGIIGGQVGFNYEFANHIVAGLEGEFAWSDVDGSFNFDPKRAVARAGGKIDDQGTVRGRLGYAFGRFLPYVTGGLAYAHTQAYANDVYNISGDEHDHGGSDAWGWTVGGGVEYAITQNVSIKAEYLHMDYGHVSYTLPIFSGAPAGSVANVRSQLTQNVIQGGINYRFW